MKPKMTTAKPYISKYVVRSNMHHITLKPCRKEERCRQTGPTQTDGKAREIPRESQNP